MLGEAFAIQLEITHEDDCLALVCPWCWETSRIPIAWCRDHADEHMPCPKCAMTSSVPAVHTVLAA